MQVITLTHISALLCYKQNLIDDLNKQWIREANLRERFNGTLSAKQLKKQTNSVP